MTTDLLDDQSNKNAADTSNAAANEGGALEALVGDGKKFATPEDLAKGKQESDVFITKLQGELDGLRGDLEKVSNQTQSLDELKAEMTELRNLSNKPKDVTSPALTKDEITGLIADTVTAQELGRTAAANVDESNGKVISHFKGDEAKASEHIRAKASDLGMSLPELRAIAEKSPSAYLKMIDLAGAVAPLKPITALSPGDSDMNSAAGIQTPDQLNPGTKPYFDAIRKKDKKAYWSPKMQQAIMAAANAGTYKEDVV